MADEFMQRPLEGVKNEVDEISPEESKKQHRRSDVDSSSFAQHHTLGVGPNQSSPGNHKHDGADSLIIPGLEDLFDTTADLNTRFAAHNHTGGNSLDIPQITGVNRGGWVPAWTSSANPQPAINDGNLIGDWLIFGPLVFLTLWWRKGPGTNVGNGFWSFTLPFPDPLIGSRCMMHGFVYNNASRYPCAAVIENGKIDRIIVSDAKAGGTPLLGSGGWKIGWFNDDYFYLAGWYWDH